MIDHLSIRELVHDDIYNLFEWRNSSDIRQFMINSSPIDFELHQKWFANIIISDNLYYYIIERHNNAIGTVNFKVINDRIIRIAEWGFYKVPGSASGSGKKICAIGIDYAFLSLNIDYIIGRVLMHNKKSIAIHEMLGFSRRTKLNTLNIHCSHSDVIIFGLAKKRWLELRKNLLTNSC